MALLLVVSRGMPSVVYPSLELARRLAVAGHAVTFAGDPDSRTLATSLGLDFSSLEPSRWDEFLVDGWVQMLRDLEPDLILIDGEMHEHIIAASGTGVPVVLLNVFASIWRRPGLPPPHVMARPGVGWKGSRIGMALFWTALRWRKRHRALRQWVRRGGRDRRSMLYRLADTVGFDLRREADVSQWLMPFTYRRLPVLSLHALEFEFPHEPPEHVSYVGPMVLQNRGDRVLTETARKRLDEILERRSREGRKLIYAAFGSVFTVASGFLERLVGVVAERPDWELLISLGERGTLESLPERVHAFSWLPQLEILEHADAVVTHGGINTIDECVLAGVPMLVYCGFETDMAGNTARVVHHGIGLAGDRNDDTLTIRRHLDRLLDEQGCLDNVARLRLSYQAYADQGVAEKTVTSLLEAALGERAP